MTEEGMHFREEVYMTPPPMPYFGVAPPSNIFNRLPERSDTCITDMAGAPPLPDYLTDEDEMDLECCDRVARGSIMILPRYSAWQPESYLSLQAPPAMPSLYSSSEDENEEEEPQDEEEDDDELEENSNCSTVPSLPCMATIRRQRSARRAAVGKKALLERANSDGKPHAVSLNLAGAQATTFVAFAA